MKDSFGRKIEYLRISVTDRCNERCVYCMPENPVDSKLKPLCHKDILTFEEITFIAQIFAEQGIKTVRLTGGEPLVRKDLPLLVEMLKKTAKIEKVFLTTNGLELGNNLQALLNAGLDGVNLSLDSLDSKIYAQITRRSEDFDDVKTVLQNLDALCLIKEKNPLFGVKVNCVLSGLNNTQLVPIAELAKNRNISVRYIELMPIGQGKAYGQNFLSQNQVLSMLEEKFGKMDSCDGVRYNYFKPKDFVGNIGFISPVTHKFCSTCNRLRITSDGVLKACLQYENGGNLKPLLADGFTPKAKQEILSVFTKVILNKPEQNSFLENKDSDLSSLEYRTMNQIGG